MTPPAADNPPPFRSISLAALAGAGTGYAWDAGGAGYPGTYVLAATLRGGFQRKGWMALTYGGGARAGQMPQSEASYVLRNTEQVAFGLGLGHQAGSLPGRPILGLESGPALAKYTGIPTYSLLHETRFFVEWKAFRKGPVEIPVAFTSTWATDWSGFIQWTAGLRLGFGLAFFRGTG